VPAASRRFLLLRTRLLVCLALLALPAALAAQPTIAGCPIFPADNIWNVPVDTLPVAANSATLLANMNPGAGLHPDFGAGLWLGGAIGIPFDVVPGSQPKVPIDFATYGWPDESDAGPYPVPADPSIEGEPGNATGDRHVLLVESGSCTLYELYYTYPNGANGCTVGTNGWCAASGAKWSLTSNALRPDGWTSADAAGLPILAGLARYEEVAAGAINHALRFTVAPTRQTWIWPARHEAGSTTSTSYPPMGLRVRLKAGFDISAFSAKNRVILTALKKYGMMLADNGGDWFISGAPNAGWNDSELSSLSQVHGSDFEVVDVSSLMVSPDSGATSTSPPPPPPPPPGSIFTDGFESGSTASWSVTVK
jgi:hypothetical protein